MLCSQIPGGAAAQRLGGHWMLLVSFLLWSMAEVLTPTDASYTLGVATARVLVGAAQGFIIPSVHTVLAQVGGSLGDGAPVLVSAVIWDMCWAALQWGCILVFSRWRCGPACLCLPWWCTFS